MAKHLIIPLDILRALQVDLSDQALYIHHSCYRRWELQHDERAVQGRMRADVVREDLNGDVRLLGCCYDVLQLSSHGGRAAHHAVQHGLIEDHRQPGGMFAYQDLLADPPYFKLLIDGPRAEPGQRALVHGTCIRRGLEESGEDPRLETGD